MVLQAMRSRWNIYRTKLLCLTIFITLFEIHGCDSLNFEGLALLEFKLKVESDPNGVLTNWNADHCDPCTWSGVKCLDGQVKMVDLHGSSLEGTMTPELGNLIHLRSLVLSGNHFSGAIPKEFGRLKNLEVLDLSDNNLSGTIPAEIGDLQSLRILLIQNNNFEERVPLEIGKLHLVSELQFDENLSSTYVTGTGCIRKFGHCSIWLGSLRPLKTINSIVEPIKGTLFHYLSFFQVSSLVKGFSDDRKDHSDNIPSSSKPHFIHTIKHQEEIRRRKLAEQSSNLAAAPANGKLPLGPVIQMPNSRSSGSFPAVPNTDGKPTNFPSPPPEPESRGKLNPGGRPTNAVKQPTNSPPPAAQKYGSVLQYLVGICIGASLLIVVVAVFAIFRSRAARNIGPWKTGLSGQLQKAFVTGVPKLNRSELETACEDFSNIVTTTNSYIIYKGTLSSGVEIAVASTTITSQKDWSKRAELTFRKKIDTFSRVNHKNYANLIGYCEEDDSFTRMMVFEYAPNGSLFEHLHVEGADHLDWPARMRTIMGAAYCLQYMHDLNPPVSHSDLNSHTILLTDDYASKITELEFWSELTAKSKSSSVDLENSELPPVADPETNVRSFGIILVEIISGKSPYSEEKEDLLNWAAQYLHDKQNVISMVDPTLKSFKNDELMVICEVIEQCLQEDPRKRPTIKEVIGKLSEAIDISPNSAVPRLSPLWWAELELLSSEAT